MSTRVFVALGSNLGDRLANCRAALDRLGQLPGTRLLGSSPLIETQPEEGVGGGVFLNGVAEIETDLLPRPLFAHLQAIEAALGRANRHEPGAARTMDLDLLLYGDRVIEEADLVIPHPRMAGRRFVLEPLVALAPGLRHPILNITAEELLRRLDPARRVSRSGVPA
ncbi:MAG TPA: 2-amino-4-hydroxy-6-hydroxymethyldihydropteridine diphosphokinase [Candidatus Methylomirabilis sp.]|nr:2-amino-4-hydroxy-6-hydroxymethyldihydropteridine diphosphokinase [Candidatus Methylomirabilis sp.]